MSMIDTRVYVAHCEEYDRAAEAVGRVLGAFGGAGAVLAGRRKVLVKPNIILPREPADASTTHPAVVEAVCAAFVGAGAEVSIIDSTGGPHTKPTLKLMYGKTGIKNAAEQSGASLSFDTTSRNVKIPEGHAVKSLDLLSPVLDAELVISVAKAKTHGFMAMTGCVKNMFGCVPGLGKPNLHRKFPGRANFAAMIIDLCQKVAPGFCILDGVWGMEGAGPTGGDPKKMSVILGGYSPYAVDLAQCYIMGLRLNSVYTIREAAARGLAPDDPGKLSWLGDDPEPLRTNFKPAIKHKNDSPPRILDSCVGCGVCSGVCPQHCINVIEGTAVVNTRDCIRCYCCHEFCPMKAIALD